MTASSILARTGDGAAAVHSFDETMRLWKARGDWARQWTTIRNFVVLLSRIRRDDEACTLLGAIDTLAEPAYGAEAVRLEQARAALRKRVGSDWAAARHREGAGMSRSAVLDLCLELARRHVSGRVRHQVGCRLRMEPCSTSA